MSRTDWAGAFLVVSGLLTPVATILQIYVMAMRGDGSDDPGITLMWGIVFNASLHVGLAISGFGTYFLVATLGNGEAKRPVVTKTLVGSGLIVCVLFATFIWFLNYSDRM